MLHEHRVLTTDQITQLAFGTTRAATARLAVLYQYRAVDRFRPLAAGRVVSAALRPGRGSARCCSRPRTASPCVSSATGATGRWRSRCRPAWPTTPGRTGSSPRWPLPPATSGGQVGSGALVGRTALRRHLGPARPPRRVRPLDPAAPRRRPARRHRLLPRVRHRDRAPDPGHRQARRVRRPRRPHRHHHPGPVLAAQPEPGGSAARPAGLGLAAAARPSGDAVSASADPRRRPRRDRRPRQAVPGGPAGAAAWLPARASPARRLRRLGPAHAPPGPRPSRAACRGRRRTDVPGSAACPGIRLRARPARLARPARRVPRPGQPADD